MLGCNAAAIVVFIVSGIALLRGKGDQPDRASRRKTESRIAQQPRQLEQDRNSGGVVVRAGGAHGRPFTVPDGAPHPAPGAVVMGADDENPLGPARTGNGRDDIALQPGRKTGPRLQPEAVHLDKIQMVKGIQLTEDIGDTTVVAGGVAHARPMPSGPLQLPGMPDQPLLGNRVGHGPNMVGHGCPARQGRDDQQEQCGTVLDRLHSQAAPAGEDGPCAANPAGQRQDPGKTGLNYSKDRHVQSKNQGDNMAPRRREDFTLDANLRTFFVAWRA